MAFTSVPPESFLSRWSPFLSTQTFITKTQSINFSDSNRFSRSSSSYMINSKMSGKSTSSSGDQIFFDFLKQRKERQALREKEDKNRKKSLMSAFPDGSKTYEISPDDSVLLLTKRLDPQLRALQKSAKIMRERQASAISAASSKFGGDALNKTSSVLLNDFAIDEPMYSYIFHNKGFDDIRKKKRSDPPSRYIEVEYALVGSNSYHASVCSDPRPGARLRQWYETAHRWGVIQRDLRPPLQLSEDKIYIPGPAFRGPKKAKKNDKKQKPMSRAERFKFRNKETEDSSELHVKAGTNLSPIFRQQKWDRMLARHPRIIAIGDVHGCIDELQRLLRAADFQPGDQVIFLGDLVAKGPDSLGVIQLAREINARSVRGNHDHEVVRWCEALRSNEKAPMMRLEHYRIAGSLSPEDIEWMRACPWYMKIPEIGHSFVHAGFVPNVRYQAQNPRLMLNMRSLLPDGTITPKQIPQYAWARHWNGPDVVVFGHDAFRGLQQYEYARGIDTGCVYGGRLTALLLPENRFVSVAARRSYIKAK